MDEKNDCYGQPKEKSAVKKMHMMIVLENTMVNSDLIDIKTIKKHLVVEKSPDMGHLNSHSRSILCLKWMITLNYSVLIESTGFTMAAFTV